VTHGPGARRRIRALLTATLAVLAALPMVTPAMAARADATLPFTVGAASQGYAPPAFGASLAPFLTRDPADCLPPGNAVDTGARHFAFEEPYVDQMATGHYDLGDPFLDCNHDGRWDGNYIGGGSNAPRLYTSVADSPAAQAVAIGNGRATIAIEVLDHEGLFNIYQAEIRSRVVSDLTTAGIHPPDSIFISSTHDESAPDSIGLYGPNAVSSSVNQYWTEDWLVPNAALAIENAVRAMRPANVRFAEPIQPDNLRQCFSSYPFIDNQLMPSFQAVAADGSVIATLADVSQHSETLGFDGGTQADPGAPASMGTVTLDQEATWVSADWQHWFRGKLQNDFPGSVAIAMAGSVGSNETPGVFTQPLSRTPQRFVDASHPAGCRTLYDAQGTEVPLGYYSETRALGEQLAAAVEGGFPAGNEPAFSTSTTIRGARADVCVEVTNTLFQAAGAAGVFGARPVYTSNCTVTVPVGPNGSTAGTELLTEVAAFQVGDGSFISVPGEVFPFTYLRGFVGPADMPFAQFAMPQWPLPHMHTPYRFIDGLGEDMAGYIFPQGNGVGVPGEYPTTNPQANSTDRFGCGHSDDSEAAGSGAADSIANVLVPLMDSTFAATSEDVVQGRYILPDGLLSRDPLGTPEIKCSVDTTFTPDGPAVGVWRSDGTIVQPAHWMSLSGRPQDAADRNTRGWIDADGTRHWLDVFPDIASAPVSVTPPANVPEAPLAPLLLVAGALVALYVYMRRRRRDGGGDPPE
jgi:hypothetical protein